MPSRAEGDIRDGTGASNMATQQTLREEKTHTAHHIQYTNIYTCIYMYIYIHYTNACTNIPHTPTTQIHTPHTYTQMHTHHTHTGETAGKAR